MLKKLIIGFTPSVFISINLLFFSRLTLCFPYSRHYVHTYRILSWHYVAIQLLLLRLPHRNSSFVRLLVPRKNNIKHLNKTGYCCFILYKHIIVLLHEIDISYYIIMLHIYIYISGADPGFVVRGA